MLIAAGFFSYTGVDPDLWGHLKFGIVNWENGTLIREDPYSYTSPGHWWINHEWATEIIMALAFSRLGRVGLLVMKLLLSVVVLAIRANKIYRFDPLIYLFVFVLGSAAIRYGANCRPHMFTYSFFGIMVYTFHLWTHGKKNT